MKKKFIKIVVASLIVTIFPLTNNFCFRGLFDSLSNVSVAQASTIDEAPVNSMKMDNCSKASTTEKTAKIPLVAPVTNHDNSVLPCCVDGSHPGIIASSQSTEIQKIIPIMFFSDLQILKVVFTSTIYNEPILSPPKLLAVNTTILRL
jgi:hypothetical protein